MSPAVSFIVPCYKLAHYLPQCVESILRQSFSDFEVLIMDDRSPDNTAEVARSFDDPRVRYVCNEQNLGSLRNYNRGLALARGRLLWLISADDYLRTVTILERYVRFLDAHPRVGYVFCPGMEVRAGRETGVLSYSRYGTKQFDRVIPGHEFLKVLLDHNCVVAAAGLMRKECYDRIGLFPLSPGMTWTGDWYLWCLGALHFDVGYLAEPMVCYRQHELSYTAQLRQQPDELFNGDTLVPWMVRAKAEEAGHRAVARRCLRAVVKWYLSRLCADWPAFEGAAIDRLLQRLDRALELAGAANEDHAWVRARVHEGLADHSYWLGQRETARQLYRSALAQDVWMPSAAFKYLMLELGTAGDLLRRARRLASGERLRRVEIMRSAGPSRP